MVRRVKAYLKNMKLITDEEKLHSMSLEIEPPGGGIPQSVHSQQSVSCSSHEVLLTLISDHRDPYKFWFYCPAQHVTSQVLQTESVNKRYRGRHTFISLADDREGGKEKNLALFATYKKAKDLGIT